MIAVATPPALETLPPQTGAKVHYDIQGQSLIVRERLDPQEATWIIAALPPATLEASVQTVIENITYPRPAQPVASPAERGESFAIPRLVVRRGQQLDLFEETIFLDHPWDLSHCDTLLSADEYSGQRQGGTEIEYDVTDKGKLKEAFIHELQQTMLLFATDQGWTPAELVYWLDRAIPHPDVTFRESNAFLTRLVMHLLDERGFTLDQLVTDKYHLRDAVTQKINAHRLEARKQTYNLFLLPDSQTPLEVHPEICFTYPRDAYPYNTLYRGTYPFKKHYYPQVGDLEDHGEEFNCAVILDTLPEVSCWVRNLERRPNHAFWLQTSTDRFYPDFVCQLKDGRHFVVEYKGEDRWSNEDSREKRVIGEVWEKKSQGKCLFMMPKGQNWEAIRNKVGGNA